MYVKIRFHGSYSLEASNCSQSVSKGEHIVLVRKKAKSFLSKSDRVNMASVERERKDAFCEGQINIPVVSTNCTGYALCSSVVQVWNPAKM